MTLAAAQLEHFRAGMRGEVLVPGARAFDQARVAWNGIFDRKPAVITRCTGSVDVQRAVDFARGHDLEIAVRGGGHSHAGASTIEGGVLIDLSPMNGVVVDARRQTAIAQGGALWGLFDRETQAHGLATTAGVVSHTGVGGLTLGGGIGRLMRKHGLTCDNVLGFDLVTADSELIHVDAETNPDLNWALRGGGGNFGIVTNFEYQLHPVGPTVLAGSLGWPAERAGDVFAGCQSLMDDPPEDLFVYIMYCSAPVANQVPEELHGKPILLANLFWAGEFAEGERLFKAWRTRVPPSFDTIGPVRYDELQSSMDALAPPGRRAYIKSGFSGQITAAHIAAAADAWTTFPSPHSVLEFILLGGKVSKVKEEDTAFSGRNAEYVFSAIALWDDAEQDEEAFGWSEEVERRFSSLMSKGLYLNFSRDEAADVRESMVSGTYARLEAIKNKYDPANVFSHNPNIKPTAAAGATSVGIEISPETGDRREVPGPAPAGRPLDHRR